MALLLITSMLCIGYPLASVACYPIYKRLGGRDSLEEYMWKL